MRQNKQRQFSDICELRLNKYLSWNALRAVHVAKLGKWFIGLFMTAIYQVRSEQGGTFSIHKNERMIVYNLDSSDVKNFCSEQKDFGSTIVSENSADFESKKPCDIYAAPKGRRPGRGLVLAPHLHILQGMVEQNPAITALEVEKRLRGLGIKFDAISAVTNLVRKHGIKLAA